ncbi:alpha/beta hydrolase [Streptomyces sp. NPDC001828]|uniref:alpha/beta hydrolase n=1 Tax=Streptomyces sp. NPDC001828 TaxID=3364615 RepID=UPI0036B3E8DD
MGMVYADPDMLDRLAKSFDNKAQAIPQLKSRATALNVGDAVSQLPANASWLQDEARDLRRRAGILRAPSESPFDSLKMFGLPVSTAGDTDAAKKLEDGLKAALAAHKDGSPQERAQAVKDYFATLSPEQQAALAATDPTFVGNLDGVPVNVRFAANRISIQKEFDAESAYFKGLAPNDPAYKRTKDRVDTLRSFLNPRIKKFVDPDTNNIIRVEVPRQFLVFDANFGSTADSKASPFPDGRVAEVVGDLESAKNVAFRVPGITNRLDNFNGFSDGGFDLAKGKDGIEIPDTAVVSWLGYDTPEVGDSVDPAKAVVGGNQLNAFRQGIAVNLQQDAKTSIFAHSYGTLVTSKALQSGLKNIDNVTFMGSPGLGPNIHSVADFHMPNTKFYAMRAVGDPVSYTQGHGDDPADFKDIIRLGTDGAKGHSDYYKSDTGSLANMRNILFGGAKELTFTHTTLDQEMPGATEARELVKFLHDRVDPEVVNRMGGDLDPIVQGLLNGRSSFNDVILPINSVLNKYNMLDRVKPADLFGEVKKLAGNLAYKQTYKAAKDRGAPDFVANIAANAAATSSRGLLSVVTWPVVKMLEFDRLQNNVRQLVGGLGSGGRKMLQDGREMTSEVAKDGRRIASDGTQLAGTLFKDGGSVALDVGDTFIHPGHVIDNAGDALKSMDHVKSQFLSKGGDAVAAFNHATNTVIDKGGSIIHTGLDTGSKALHKGADVVDSALNFVGF